jgi:hypothetical protein
MLNDDRLREALEKEGGGAEPVLASQNLVRRFERGRKKLRIYSAFWHWVGLLVAAWGARIVMIAESTPSQFRGLVLFLFGACILIVIKLWWWIADNRVVLLQGVKELQIQVAALEERIEVLTGEKGGSDA